MLMEKDKVLRIKKGQGKKNLVEKPAHLKGCEDTFPGLHRENVKGLVKFSSEDFGCNKFHILVPKSEM